MSSPTWVGGLEGPSVGSRSGREAEEGRAKRSARGSSAFSCPSEAASHRQLQHVSANSFSGRRTSHSGSPRGRVSASQSAGRRSSRQRLEEARRAADPTTAVSAACPFFPPLFGGPTASSAARVAGAVPASSASLFSSFAAGEGAEASEDAFGARPFFVSLGRESGRESCWATVSPQRSRRTASSSLPPKMRLPSFEDFASRGHRQEGAGSPSSEKSKTHRRPSRGASASREVPAVDSCGRSAKSSGAAGAAAASKGGDQPLSQQPCCGVSSPSDIDRWIAALSAPSPSLLPEAKLWEVCEAVKELLIEESNVLAVPAPVVVCGDIHGQRDDLLKLLSIGGPPCSTRYLFLGDYVDRGQCSVETFQLLMLLKLRRPDKVILLRGNHETRQVTSVYGFYDECLRKYGNANPWRVCCEVFDYMALAAIIDDAILCVHGGLSPRLPLLDGLSLLQRVGELPNDGPLGDIAWSDPDELVDWEVNPRGAGWLFGQQPVRRFLHRNGLDLIARAHQLVMEGFRYSFADASVLTIWSAPNYCQRCGNVASILRLNERLERELLIFDPAKKEGSSGSPKQLGAASGFASRVPYFL